MANLDPTGVLSSIASLAVERSVIEIYNQFHYKDNLDVLHTHLKFLEELEKHLQENSAPFQALELEFLGQIRIWTIKTRNLYDSSQQAVCLCQFRKRRSIYNGIKRQLEALYHIGVRASFLKLLRSQDLISEMPTGMIQPTPEHSQLVGVDQRLKLLSERLLDDDKSRIPSKKWIGICAMGGAGKTLLAQLVFNSTQVSEQFEERFWITVSRCREVEMLQAELLMQMEKRECKIGHKADGKATIFNRLRGKRVLLVLDDVWSYNVLEWLDVVDGTCGSKILVTTRNQRVLDHVNAGQVSFKLLTEEESWKLFDLNAGLRNILMRQLSSIDDGQLIFGTAQEVSRQCKGLPLALKVIGKAMRGRTQVWQWQRMLRKLQRALQLDREEEQGLYEVLKVSFEELGEVNDRGAKYQECFLGMAAFPEDEEVPVKELIRTWKPVVQDEKVAMEIAQELEDRCLIQSSLKNRAFPLLPNTKHYMIHDVLRDMALKILGNYSCLFAAGTAMTQDEFEATLGSRNHDFATVYRMSLRENQITDLSPIKVKAPELRMLLLDGNKHLKHIPNDMFENASNLQVLTCTRAPIVEWPKSLGSLKELRVLEAFGLGVSSGIRLGDISELKKLEFLHTNFYIARDCNFLADFKALRHLSIEEYFISVSSNCLTNLVNLETIDLNLEDVNSITPALYTNKFQKLSMLRLWYKGEETMDFWLGVFKHSVQLEFLCLRNGNKYQPAFSLGQLPAKLPRLKVVYLNNPWLTFLPATLGEPQGFPQLQILDLKCKALQALPKLEKGSLTKLSTLTILDCVVMKSLPQSWMWLTNLEMLELRECRSIEKCFPQESSGLLQFQKLRSLDLSGTKVSSIPRAVFQLPLLRYLDIRGCRRLHEENLNGFGNIFVAHSGLDDDQLKKKLKQSGLHVEDTLACASEHQHVKSHAKPVYV